MIESTVTEESKTRKFLKKVKARDAMYYGYEPDIKISSEESAVVIDSKFVKAFNWYSYSCDKDKAKEWIVEYSKTIFEEDDVEAIKQSDEYTTTAGWISRIILKGTQGVPAKYKDYVNDILCKMKSDGMMKLESNKDRLLKLQEGKEKAKRLEEYKKEEELSNVLSELNYQIDLFIENNFKTNFSFIKLCEDKKIIQEHITYIRDVFLLKILLELEEVLEGEDEDLKEAYSYMSKSSLKKNIDFIQNIIDDCDLWMGKAPSKNDTIRKPRKARKRRVKSPSEQVKKLNYKSEDKEFNLKSIEPNKIVNAVELWVFNCKYRNLGRYVACDSSGFTIKGSTIKNFNESTSIEKKLRKPKNTLEEVLNGGKVSLRKIMDSIKCKERKLTGRLNKDTIIIRVV